MNVRIFPPSKAPSRVICPPLPADKSLAHRWAMLAAMAQGRSELRGFPLGEDNQSTLRVLRGLGAHVESTGADVVIDGGGMHGFRAPAEPLDCGNSGTTTRLMMGILAAQPFATSLYGDASLSSRPMKRVAEPLTQMGARIEYQHVEGKLPLTVRGGTLRAIDYRTPVASAQIKSAIMLAGLYADGITRVTEPELSRDHTERLLTALGVHVGRNGLTVAIQPPQTIAAFKANAIPDISSASFWLTAAVILGCEIVVDRVGLNPTRTGLLDALRQAGQKVEVTETSVELGEPVGTIRVSPAPVRPFQLSGSLMVAAIDEFPILAALAAVADGESEFSGIGELRVKESDRVAAMQDVLSAMGVESETSTDRMLVRGRPGRIVGALVEGRHDHRIVMAAAVLALTARGQSEISTAEAARISYPTFFEHLAGFGNPAIAFST